MSTTILPVAAGLLAALPLGPVYLVTYAVVAGFVYFMLALIFDLPLPGASRGGGEPEPPAAGRGDRGGSRPVPPARSRRR